MVGLGVYRCTKPRVFRESRLSQVFETEKMFLSHRARVTLAKVEGVPNEDVLRLARPENYVKVL